MPQQPTSQQSSRGEKQTLIEQGTEFKGTMKSTCPVVVNGRIEGELSAPELDVTTTGSVRGNIKADRLSSRGVLSGNIDAGDLFLSGSVGSKTVIKAKNLEVKLAPDQGRMELTIGECTLDVGDEPSKERRSDPALKAGIAGTSTSQLPVTKSLPPASAAPPEKEASDPAASPPPPGSVKAEASDADKARQSSSGFALSKPPPSKKAGARDSVPPGAG
ncbi:MAG TPA: polymer-forming cytoskeletal protein [Polyangiaceae bacterium]|nr:polymer-forming cytoskeletal protein [Polyangiaceae bacterium]